MTTPAVSAIVPVYNGEHSIRKCIDSLLNQTFHDIEIIIIDDGSVDRSAEICKQYEQQDGRLKYFHQKNSGVSAARNIGLQKATGKYVLFSDCDDYYEVDAIEKMLGIAEKEKADLIVGSVEKSIYDRIEIASCDDVIASSKEDLGELFKQLIGNYLLKTLWGKLFRRAIIHNNKLLLDEKMTCGEDYEWVCRFACHVQCAAAVRNIVYHYSIHSRESLSQKINQNYYINIDKQYHSSKNLFISLRIWETNNDILIEQQIQNIINGYFRLIKCGLTTQEKIEYLKKCQKMNSIQECRRYIISKRVPMKYHLIRIRSPYLVLCVITLGRLVTTRGWNQ